MFLNMPVIFTQSIFVYDPTIDKMLQEERICKRKYAQKETLNIVNSMQQLPQPEAGLENRNENFMSDLSLLSEKVLQDQNLLI